LCIKALFVFFCVTANTGKSTAPLFHEIFLSIFGNS
jgi:hypothetical protein